MLADDTVVRSIDVRTAIVTGGASGIGRATCEVLSRQGFLVAVFDRDELGARGVADAIGGHAFAVDVTDELALPAAFERALAALGGRLDALATPAGIVDVTPFMALDAATFRRVFEINVIGTYLCVREAARHMQSGARICTVASVAAERGGESSGTAAYAASKGAVAALTREAARSLAERGIAVNAIAPGPLLAPVTQVAEAIAWLLSPNASYVNGQTLVVDGGLLLN